VTAAARMEDSREGNRRRLGRPAPEGVRIRSLRGDRRGVADPDALLWPQTERSRSAGQGASCARRKTFHREACGQMNASERPSLRINLVLAAGFVLALLAGCQAATQIA